jgi:ribose transport system ATP-binding protein
MKTEILCLEKVFYPPFLDDINLHILKGEIVGLIPINILGVDELVQLISEGLPLHYGFVSYDGTIVNDYLQPSPKKNNIMIIDKDSNLIDSMTVYENLFVIRKGFSKHIINKKMLYEQTLRLLKDVNINISPDIFVGELDVYEKVAIELVKAQVIGSKLVILKDISSFIHEKDILLLHKLMKKLSKKGMSFLYICNHHQEAFLISHRCYLMKEGHMVKNLNKDEMKDKVMLYYSYVFEQSLSTEERKELYENNDDGDLVLSIKNICYESLTNLSFDLHKGETIVLLDSDNSVIDNLSKLLKNESMANSGKILIGGKSVNIKDRNLAFVDKKSLKSSLFNTLSVMDNILFCADHKLKYIWTNHKVEKALAKSLEKDFGKMIYEKDLLNLNESELFKVLNLKILFQKPLVLVLVQPFSFLDMYQRLQNIEYFDKLKKRGISILILALSLSDTLQVSDKLLLATEGKIVRSYNRKEFSSLSNLHGSLPNN